MGRRWSWKSLPVSGLDCLRILQPLIFAVLIAGCRSGPSMPAAPPSMQPEGVVTPLPASIALTLNLAECKQLALERQPRIAAHQASLAASVEGKTALETLRIPASLARQIPIRELQFALGYCAAEASLQQAIRDADYAVTRTYCAVLYAREQEVLARALVERLAAAKDAAEKGLDAGVRDVTAADVNRSTVYVRLAETRRIHATQGVKRALIALREAIGLGPETILDVPPGLLPHVAVRPKRDEVVGLALARRGELTQARVFAQVACLENGAQALGRLQRMQTFASGTDVHATQVPQPSYSQEYRPGGVVPEMPPLLVGTRGERIKQAQIFSARAETVVEATRNLIVLETEDAFLRWEEASLQTSQAEQAAEAGEKLADDLRKDFTGGLKVRVEEVVTARALAAQARADYNEFRFHEVLALADLERVTAGGFSPGLANAIGRSSEPAKSKQK
jgi:outer membrane protein TolC